VDFGVCEDEQGPQEGGGVPGVHADLGQEAPGLQVREAVLDGGTFAVEQAIRSLLRVGEAVRVPYTDGW
jgi:hypothetical protein